MNQHSSDCLVLALSKEIEHLSNYQGKAFQRILNSINPKLRERLSKDLLGVHERLMALHQSAIFLNLRRLTIGSSLLYEQSKRAARRSASLSLTCS